MPLTQNHSTRLFVTTTVTVGVLIAFATLQGASGGNHPAPVMLSPEEATPSEDVNAVAVIADERTSAAIPMNAEGSGFYLLPAGRQLEMDFTASARSKVRFQEDAGDTAFSMNLGGQLNVLVVAETEEELVLQMSVLDLETSVTTAEGPVDPAAASQFAGTIQSPSLARMDRNGQLLGYRFDESADAQARNLHRTLWSGFTAEFTDLEVDAWSASRQDASGPFELAYTWESRADEGPSGTLKFEKLSQATESEDGQMEIVESQGVAEVDGTERWLSHVVYEETLRLEVPSAETVVTVASVLEFTLNAATNQPLPADPFDWSFAWDPASGARDADAPKPYASSASHELALEGVDAIALRIEELIEAGEFSSYAILEAEQALKLLMLEDPENVEKLAELIKAGMLSEKAESVLLAAAGMAATPEAQGLLATTFDDVEASDTRRKYAAWSMLQVESPTPQVIDTVMASLDNQDLSAGMKSTSLLTAGAVSSRVKGEARDTLLSTLLAEEERARDEGRLRTWLNALGNAGFPETLPHIAPYFTHQDAQLRATACSAVRKLPLEEATELLLKALRQDEDAIVRTAAAETVAPRHLEDVNRVLGQQLRTEESEAVLGAIIGKLGKRKPFDEDAERLVRTFANTTTVQSLREQAQAVLQERL